MKNWAWLFIFIMVGDLVVPYLLAPFYKGYSHTKSVMSYLGNPKSPVRLLYSGWLVIGGIVFVLCAISFFKQCYQGNGLFIAVLVLMLIYAIGGMILSGFFSVGPTKEMLTLSAKIHGYGSTLGFMSLLFIPLLLAIGAGKQDDITSMMICSISFALALATFALFVMADKTTFQNTIIADEGTWQRLTLLFMYCPIVLFCMKTI